MWTAMGLGSPEVMTILVPIMIFFARIADVSIGTIRIVFVARGRRGGAALLGFLEVFIWLVTISQVLQNMHGWITYLFYSAGFGAGTFVGMTIERRMALGKSIVRIVAAGDTGELWRALSSRGIPSTRVKGEGAKGPVDVVFSVVQRRAADDILALLKQSRPDAFYSLEDVRLAKDFTPGEEVSPRRHFPLGPFFGFRKSK